MFDETQGTTNTESSSIELDTFIDPSAITGSVSPLAVWMLACLGGYDVTKFLELLVIWFVAPVSIIQLLFWVWLWWNVPKLLEVWAAIGVVTSWT